MIYIKAYEVFVFLNSFARMLLLELLFQNLVYRFAVKFYLMKHIEKKNLQLLY